jgi:hypothetical protein
VPTTLINPGKYKKFPYKTTPRKRRVEISIEANMPIQAYIVGASGLEDWRKEHNFDGWSFPADKRVKSTITIPRDFESEWFLIVENPSDDSPVAVHYELFDL